MDYLNLYKAFVRKLLVQDPYEVGKHIADALNTQNGDEILSTIAGCDILEITQVTDTELPQKI